jgi:phosphatidylglycerol:prolipoprotein diacylglycerol transferase
LLPFPDIDPNIIEIGPIRIRWYGMMYLFGFLASYFLIRRQSRARNTLMDGQMVQNLIFYLAMGLLIGARLGYVLVYQFPYGGDYLKRPWEIIAVWHGGMSFHGGLVGAILAGLWFCRRYGLPFWQVADRVIVTAPIGIGLGRIGNFINGELFGRPTSMPWAMIFPLGGAVPRHPSQLYEAVLEGLLLFLLLWRLKDLPFRPGAMVVLFLWGYGLFRFFLEFFREPDPQVGLFLDLFSMGQLLCLTMIAAGSFLWFLLPVPPSGD